MPNIYTNNSKIKINFTDIPLVDDVINLTETSLGLTMNIVFKETRVSTGQSALPSFQPEDGIHLDRWIGFVSTDYRTAFMLDYNTTNNFYVLNFPGTPDTGIGQVEIFATFNNAVFTLTSNTSPADITITNTTTTTPPGGVSTFGNQIQLNWASASDDIGIKGYEISYNIDGSPTWNSLPMVYKSTGSGSYSFILTSQVDHNFAIRTVDTSNQKSEYIYLTVPVTPNILISLTPLDDNNSACGLLTPTVIIELYNGTIGSLVATAIPVFGTYVQYPDDGTSTNLTFNGTVNGSIKFWKVLSNGIYYSCKIDSTGKVINVVDCSSLPIPKKLYISPTGYAAVNNLPPSTMCSLTVQNNVYYMGTSLSVGTIINNNSDGLNVSSPFSGGNKYYLLADDTNTTTQVAKISSSPAGKVTQLLSYASLNCPITPCCLLPGTKITLFNGEYINIEDLIGGEVVLTYNIEKNTFEKGMVTKIFQPLHNDIIKLIIGETIIDCTSTHPFWSVNKNKWVSLNPKETALSMDIDVEQLEKGDILLNEKNEKVILNDIIIIESEDIITYDISVEPNNTYYANGVLVHNKLAPRLSVPTPNNN